MKAVQIVVADFNPFVRIPSQAVKLSVFIFADTDDFGFFFIAVINGNVSDADNILRIDKQN